MSGTPDYSADFDPEERELDAGQKTDPLARLANGMIVYASFTLESPVISTVAKVSSDEEGGQRVLRCWQCYPDGSGGEICIRIERPFTLPPPNPAVVTEGPAMMQRFTIPEDFDPDQHLRPTAQRVSRDLPDGVTIYDRETVTGTVEVFRIAKLVAGESGGDAQRRCFECHTRPNGDVDCYVVDCPPPVVLEP